MLTNFVLCIWNRIHMAILITQFFADNFLRAPSRMLAAIIANWNMSGKNLIDFKYLLGDVQVSIDALVNSLVYDMRWKLGCIINKIMC